MNTQLVHKTVDFYGDELVAIEQDGIIYTPVKPICDILGITWNGQYERIQRDEVLSSSVRKLRIDIMRRDEGVAVPMEMMCLPAEMLHGWLFGVSVNQIAEHNREHLLRYKRECYQALHQAFTRTSSLDALEHIPDEQLLAYADLREQEAQVRLTLERIDAEKQALLRGELPLPGHRRTSGKRRQHRGAASQPQISQQEAGFEGYINRFFKPDPNGRMDASEIADTINTCIGRTIVTPRDLSNGTLKLALVNCGYDAPTKTTSYRGVKNRYWHIALSDQGEWAMQEAEAETHHTSRSWNNGTNNGSENGTNNTQNRAVPAVSGVLTPKNHNGNRGNSDSGKLFSKSDSERGDEGGKKTRIRENAVTPVTDSPENGVRTPETAGTAPSERVVTLDEHLACLRAYLPGVCIAHGHQSSEPRYVLAILPEPGSDGAWYVQTYGSNAGIEASTCEPVLWDDPRYEDCVAWLKGQGLCPVEDDEGDESEEAADDDEPVSNEPPASAPTPISASAPNQAAPPAGDEPQASQPQASQPQASQHTPFNVNEWQRIKTGKGDGASIGFFRFLS